MILSVAERSPRLVRTAAAVAGYTGDATVTDTPAAHAEGAGSGLSRELFPDKVNHPSMCFLIAPRAAAKYVC